MPTEERFITFDLEEVYKALTIQCIKDECPQPPEGTLKSIKISDDPDDTDDALIHLQVEKRDGQSEAIKFYRTFFAQALIFYCQGNGIPLPRRGQKILAVREDAIIMKVVLESAPAQSA